MWSESLFLCTETGNKLSLVYCVSKLYVSLFKWKNWLIRGHHWSNLVIGKSDDPCSILPPAPPATLTWNFSDKNGKEFAAHSAHIKTTTLASDWLRPSPGPLIGQSLGPSSRVQTALECTFKVIIQECTVCSIARHNGLKTESWSINQIIKVTIQTLLSYHSKVIPRSLCCMAQKWSLNAYIWINLDTSLAQKIHLMCQTI